jgi:pimeloyl-ACP methyl ester carboxylesterase
MNAAMRAARPTGETDMFKLMRSLLIGAALVAVSVPAVTEAATPAAPAAAVASKPTKSGYVEVNGVRYYYEIRGQGAPLLLLHGGLGSTDMFAPIYPALAARRQVIAVDLYGHGRTALTDRPFSLENMGGDMDAILKALGYGKVDVMGYSLGGGVAFQLAVQHPERVNRLVLVSTGYARDGFYADMLKQQAQVNGQAAACATPAGSVRTCRRTAWPSCPAAPTTTSSWPPSCRRRR